MTVFGVSFYFPTGAGTIHYAKFQADGQSQFAQFAGFYGWQKGGKTSGWASAFLQQPQHILAGHQYIALVRVANGVQYGYMVASRATGVATVHGDFTFPGDTASVPNAGTQTTCQEFLTGTLSGRLPCIDVLYRK